MNSHNHFLKIFLIIIASLEEYVHISHGMLRNDPDDISVQAHRKLYPNEKRNKLKIKYNHILFMF